MSGGRQYRLLRELGTGTFGTVYQAEMTSAGGFKKAVALKVLHPVWEADKDAARRFRDEARLLGQLRHRHIVQVDGLVKVGGRWAVVMEFVPGSDTSVVLKACRKAGEPFPVPAALEVVSAVAQALDAAYNTKSEESEEALRVIHRDIKPSNIRLTQDGDVKVLDFGIARANFTGREAVTHSIRYGSVRYMAPERHRSSRDSPAGDTFALGCVLYELLTGRPLGSVEAEWAQHHEKVHAKVMKLREGLASLSTGTSATPAPDDPANGVVQLISGMLAFEPDKRPSASDVAERARHLARVFPGEDLAGFARRFIPEVPRWVPDTSMPIERVVSETVGSSEGAQPRSGLPHTLVESDDDRAVRKVPVWAILGGTGVALLLLLLIVGFGVTALIGGTITSAATTKPPPPELLATTPPPEPTTNPPVEPVHDPVVPVAPADTDVPEVAVVDPPVEPIHTDPPETPHTDPSHGTHTAPTSDEPRPIKKPDPPVLPVVAPVQKPVAAEGPRVRAVKFTQVRASAITADCPGASASGTTSALVRDLTAGTCLVTATVNGQQYTAKVDVTAEGGLLCEIDGSGLSCH